MQPLSSRSRAACARVRRDDGGRRLAFARRPLFSSWLNQSIEDSSVRATVFSITSQADAIGQWTGGPAIGVIGNAFGIRAALLVGAFLLSPALWLYGRAARHGGAEPELERLPVTATS